LIHDEQALLSEIDENNAALIDRENELQMICDKLAVIKRAVPEDVQISNYIQPGLEKSPGNKSPDFI
jgi:hypothetical protein